MEIFAVIVLVFLIIVITHLHNWVIRVLLKEGNSPALFVLTLFYALCMHFAVKYLILWGYPLIAK
jgi:hypothetical protein